MRFEFRAFGNIGAIELLSDTQTLLIYVSLEYANVVCGRRIKLRFSEGKIRFSLAKIIKSLLRLEFMQIGRFYNFFKLIIDLFLTSGNFVYLKII